MISSSLLSTSSRVQDRRSEFWLISRPEVATPPALLAFPGANNTPPSWNTATASGVHGILAPSATAITWFSTSIFASSPFSSFWVAQGSATSTFIPHSPLRDGSGSDLVKVTPSNLSAYSLILPLRLFFRSIIQSSFSLSIPFES